jgi:hypothetical protein
VKVRAIGQVLHNQMFYNASILFGNIKKSDKIKDKMDGACSTHGTDDKHNNYFGSKTETEQLQFARCTTLLKWNNI